MSTVRLAGLTAAELAVRLPPSPLDAATILRDLEAAGLAEQDGGGGWRLTANGWWVARGLLDAAPVEGA